MPRSSIDMCGQKFGRWHVLERAETPAYEKNQGRAYWLCRCECGTERVVRGNGLRNGSTLSCGCLQVERSSNPSITHGNAKRADNLRMYQIWHGMLARCFNEKHDKYTSYGGRGITVCERWKSFEMFINDMGECTLDKTIDRINNDGNYEPGNCRWATRKEQQENRSVSLNYEHNGRRMSLKDWSIELGISYSALRSRIRVLGWSIDSALSTPVLIDRSKKCR